MQLVLIAHGGCTSFQIRYVSIVVSNNQRTLKLSRVSGVDAEIRAEFHRTAHPLGNIDKRAIAEDGAVQGCKEIVLIRYHRAQILLHQVAVFLDSLTDRAEDNTLFAQLLLKGGLYAY